jgi:hypothetical protein
VVSHTVLLDAGSLGLVTNRDKVHLDVGSAGPFHKPPGEGDGATGLPDFC